MSIINPIRAVLDNQLTTTTDVPPIAFQNVPYEHTVDTLFVKATTIPTSRRISSIASPNQLRYQGLYSILVCAPERQGPGVGYDWVDTLLDRFRAGSELSYNGQYVTIEYSEVGASYLDSPFYCTPITVGWYTYST